MADLDTLQIQISASTSQADDAISRLQKALGSLNASLSNYSDASNYVKGLANLTTGLNGMADAVDRIDTAKIKNIASAIGSLATNGGKLSNLNVAKALSTMGSAAQESSARTKKAVEEIASSFDITSKTGISELTGAVEQFYSVVDDPVAVKAAENNIRDIINTYTQFGTAVEETKEAVREWVSDSNLFLNKDTVAEMGDDFARLRGIIGIQNTNTTDLTKAVGLDVFVEEMNKALGLSIEWGNSVQEIASNLANYLEGGSDMSEEFAEYARNSTLQAERLSEALDKLYASMGRVREAQAEPDYYGAGDGLEYDIDLPFADDTVSQMDAVTAASREMKSSIDSASVSVENVKEELSQEIGNPFAGIVEGISSLVGFEITADQFSGIKTLADSLGKLAGKNAPLAAQNLPAIAQGLQMLSGVNIPAGLGGQLTELGAAVGKLGGKYATNAQGLIHVAEGITALASATNTMPNLDAIRELANAVAAFGRKGAGNAIANLPLLAEGFRNLIVTLSTAPNVSRNVIDLANAMAQVASSGAKVGTASVSGANGLKLFGHSAKQAHTHFKGLASTFGRLYANFFLLIRAVRLFKKAIDISSDLREVQNVVATTFGSATDKVQEFADTAILSFGMSELSAKQFASRFQAMGVAMNVTSEQVARANDFLATKLEGNTRAYQDLGDSMADVSINLTKLTADMASFYNADYEDVAEDMAAVMTGMTRPLRKYGLDLTEATLKEWALANGLDGNIKKMTQAEKTMLRYQYVMANMGHVMGDFVKTQDTWANVTRTIGQQFQKLGQIIGTGFINAFKPALIAFREFMNTLIALTEKALNALGKLMGWQVEIEDVGVTLEDDMGDYADAIDDAAGNAKKLNAQLRGIDELNNLTSKDKSGSGSGNGGGNGGLSDALTGGKINIVPYESDIESWYDFGKRIADKIKSALDSIEWDKVYAGARMFGQRFAEFLNGLITPETFKKFGETIAKALNAAIANAVSFAKNFDWKNLGLSLAAQINGFFDKFEFGLLADTIDAWVQGIWDTIKAAILGDENGEGGIDFDLIKSKLTEFFKRLDKETYILLASLFLTKKLGGLVKDWLVNSFTNALSAALKGIKGLFTTFAKTIFGAISAPWTSLGGLGGILKTDLSVIMGAGTATEIGMTIGVGIAGGILAGILGFKLGKKLGEFLDPEAKEFYENFTWFGEDGFFQTLTSSIQDGTITGAFRLMLEDMKKDLDAAFPGIKKFNEDVANDFKKAISDTKTELQKFKEGFQQIGSNIKSWWNGSALPWMKNTMIAQLVGVFTAPGWKEDIKGAFSLMWRDVKALWTDKVKPWFDKTVIGQLIAIFSDDDWKNTVVGAFGLMWEDVKSIWTDNIKPWFDNTVIGQLIGIFTSKDWKNDVIGAFHELWNDIQSIFNISWNLPELKLPHISWESGGSEASGVVKKILEALSLPTSLPKLKVDWYASGGYPSKGSLFYAGEAGAEMLGTVGGRTAVASNGEITGIASAIYETASQTNALLQAVIVAIDEKETGITDDSLFRSVRRSANSYQQRTGNAAF